MKNRIIRAAVICIALTAVLVVSGCGKKQEQSASGPVETAEAAETEESIVPDGETDGSSEKELPRPAIDPPEDLKAENKVFASAECEAVRISGPCAVKLTDCSVSGSRVYSEAEDCTWNVILFCRAADPSEQKKCSFTMNGGALKAEHGGMFYVTNTKAQITLCEVDLTYSDENDFLLRCMGSSQWVDRGTPGKNGAKCTFTAKKQHLEGIVCYDSISSLKLNITENSTYAGAIVRDEIYAGDGGRGGCSVYLDASSVWTVTDDSFVTQLTGDGSIVDVGGNAVTVRRKDGTILRDGESEYFVTVGK